MDDGIDLERKKVRLSLRSKKEVKTPTDCRSSDLSSVTSYEHALQRNNMMMVGCANKDDYRYVGR